MESFADALKRERRRPLERSPEPREWEDMWRARLGDCPECGTNLFDAGRSLDDRGAVYCSDACKQRAYRRRVTVKGAAGRNASAKSRI